MKTGRPDIQNPLGPGAGPPSGLFHDESQRGRFIEQPQLSLRVFGVARIEKDAALKKRSMEIGHQRAHVA